MTAAGNRPTGTMEPTGNTRQGTGGSVDDYKVVIRPRDGLNFSAWTIDKITRARIAMAQLSATEMAQATRRIRQDQNLVVVSTPNMESSTRVKKISALILGINQYEVTAYLAVPDNSCRGVISGVETRLTAEELTENLRATGINILYVPRFVYLSGWEYPCRPYQPKQQVCDVCLGPGHRTDVCPKPEQSHCTTYGAPGGAMEDNECTTHCVMCGGEHPAIDPRCPARKRAPYNKEHVARYLREKEQQRTPPSPSAPLPYNALASHHWPELPSYNRVIPDSTIPTNVEEKEYDRSSSGPPPGQPSHIKRNASPERNGYRRNQSDNVNKVKTQQREQQRRPDQQNQPEITTPEPGHKGGNVEALDATLRTAVKTAVGLPQHASTNRLLQLGLHNTLEELIEAQQTGQMTRLGRTTTGRGLLPPPWGRQKPAPPTIAAKVRVMSILKNMHPQAHEGRRLACVRYFHKRYHHDPEALYTDTCDSDGCNGTVASLRGSPTCAEAEESAIALNMSTTDDKPNIDPDTTTVTILTNSQAACRAWAGARDATLRALPQEGRHDRPLDDHVRDSTRNPPNPPMDTYTQITEYYRMSRRTYPSPHKSLTRQNATDWRKLQTLSFPNLLHLHRFFHDRDRYERPGCHSPGPTLYHCTWACPTPVGAAVLASQPDMQLALLDRARRVAQACVALD
ncbi:hypothetical protein HPB47_026022 [Ixodes persulcatus]|uniref:Uncharacterized protein n=1 Tax=Ixodes persulcatus TaxID=34615 RepID=A0AC60Q0K2_IXOPE|nr:hypothetical protein HPB47_026022 [Ixodes persulcatus]